jgi:hypothetical protein
VAGAEVWQPVWARGQPPPGEPMHATTAG